MDDATSPSAPGAVSCSICGDPLKSNDRYCGSCGALVNACRSCGQRLLAGDRYCPSCGMTADPALVTARISGGNADSAHSPWAGIFDRLQTATLGEFQVIRELGRGGMAAVFLAHDIHLDRKVAIKVMSPLLSTDQRMVERFRREAKTGAGLKHPNIGTVHRVLEGEGLYFFVMDFIRGRPLDAIIHRNGVLSVDVTRALLYQIGSGLAYAHRRKIYHRDVKPANVLVSATDGTAVVTDFGIAKVAESPNQTQTGAIVGTPAYMAPEQILGREITAAVDQYALGVMAYEMLTGAPPFVGTSFVVMHAHTELIPRSIRESRPDCPDELDDAIARMLAKDPAQRWPSLSHALAGMGATLVAEDDPIRDELIRLATPDDVESARFVTNTPLSPPPGTARGAGVAMIAISPPPDIVEVGDSFKLAASPRDANGQALTSVPVEWASNNDEVLSVQSDGTVIARSPGSAEVSATAGRARGAVLLTVEPSKVSNLHVSIPPGQLIAGDRVQLAAHVVDKRQNPLAYPVHWGVADPNIARISPEGVLEARSPGTVEVFAESNGVRAAARVQVAPPAVAGVQLSADPLRPVVGDRIRVTATPVDSHGRPLRDRRVEWSLNEPSLANTISDGLYEANAPGTLTVIVSCDDEAASIDVVIEKAPVASVRVAPPPSLVVVGTKFQLSATVSDAKGRQLHDRTVEWSCSDPGLATIASDGTCTARAPGDLRIVATCEGKTASVAVTIKPAPVAAVKINGLPQVVYVKMPLRLTAIVTDARGQQLLKTPEWRSSNAAVVTMSQNGQGTALSVGHARISAIVDGVEGVVDVDVAEPAIPKILVVPAPPPVPAELSASAIVAKPDLPPPPPSLRESSAAPPVPGRVTPPPPPPPAPPRENIQPPPVPPTTPIAPTPVVAPTVNRPPAPATRGGRGGLLIGGSIGLVVVAIAATLLLRSGAKTPVPGPDTTATIPAKPQGDTTTPAPVPAQPEAKPEAKQPEPPQPKATPSQPATKTTTPSKSQPSGQSPAQKNVAVNPGTVPTNPATQPVVEPPPPPRDAFTVSIAPVQPMRVGDRVPLTALVDRTSGSGAIPRATWTSSNAGVLSIDPSSGVATAVGAGQTTVTATVPGAHADLSVSVGPAVVAPPPPQKTAPEPKTASADELRRAGTSQLRDAANAMLLALRGKDVSGVTRLIADGRNNDSQDLTKQLPNLFDLKVTMLPGTPQLGDRSGSLDYQIKIEWVSAAGPHREKTVSFHAEAERVGDVWEVPRQRITGGWR